MSSEILLEASGVNPSDDRALQFVGGATRGIRTLAVTSSRSPLSRTSVGDIVEQARELVRIAHTHDLRQIVGAVEIVEIPYRLGIMVVSERQAEEFRAGTEQGGAAG